MRGILLWSRHNKNLVDFQKNLGLVRHKKLWAGRRGKVFVLPAQLPRWGATGACMWSRSCGPSDPYPQLPGLPPQLSGTHLPLLSNGGQTPPPKLTPHTFNYTIYLSFSIIVSTILASYLYSIHLSTPMKRGGSTVKLVRDKPVDGPITPAARCTIRRRLCLE